SSAKAALDATVARIRSNNSHEPPGYHYRPKVEFKTINPADEDSQISGDVGLHSSSRREADSLLSKFYGLSEVLVYGQGFEVLEQEMDKAKKNSELMKVFRRQAMTDQYGDLSEEELVKKEQNLTADEARIIDYRIDQMVIQYASEGPVFTEWNYREADTKRTEKPNEIAQSIIAFMKKYSGYKKTSYNGGVKQVYEITYAELYQLLKQAKQFEDAQIKALESTGLTASNQTEINHVITGMNDAQQQSYETALGQLKPEKGAAWGETDESQKEQLKEFNLRRIELGFDGYDFATDTVLNNRHIEQSTVEIYSLARSEFNENSVADSMLSLMESSSDADLENISRRIDAEYKSAEKPNRLEAYFRVTGKDIQPGAKTVEAALRWKFADNDLLKEKNLKKSDLDSILKMDTAEQILQYRRLFSENILPSDEEINEALKTLEQSDDEKKTKTKA
ncbi:MAG: hypothetical protein KC649_07360, partial [Candidatus Omnitrophica bacterium]|nr:hypothetical protein [Candidatus Omnitrophota bacterium]